MNDGPTPLVLLWRLWAGVAVGLIAVTTLVLVAADRVPTVPVVLPVALVVAAGAGAIVGARAIDSFFAASPPADDETALAEFRQRAYLAIGIAEAPVLLGVAVAFALGPGWVAAVGTAAGLVVLAVARPTAGRIRRIEAAWQAAGTDVSVLRAARGDATQP